MCSQSNPVILLSRRASQKRKQWIEADMQSAIDAVKGREKILRVAKQLQQTLQDRISGGVIHRSNPYQMPRRTN